MKRLPVIACAAITFILISFIFVRVATKRKASPGHPSPGQVQLMHRIVDAFALVRTRPLGVEDFDHAVRLRAGTNVDGMSANEREKLFACINRFYSCYSSGDFEAFKQFRIRPPFRVSERLTSAVKRIASEKGLPLMSEEDVFHFAWDNYSGTNRIGEVDEQNIILSTAKRQNLGEDLRRPSTQGIRLDGQGASCWEGALVYQPTPAELLGKEGSLRFFTLEVSVRFNSFKDGPATPLVLIGYWDRTRDDWMPYCLCTAFHAGSYDTIF